MELYYILEITKLMLTHWRNLIALLNCNSFGHYLERVKMAVFSSEVVLLKVSLLGNVNFHQTDSEQLHVNVHLLKCKCTFTCRRIL